MKFMVFIFHCDKLILFDYKKKASCAFFNFIFNLGKFSTKEKKHVICYSLLYNPGISSFKSCANKRLQKALSSFRF